MSGHDSTPLERAVCDRNFDRVRALLSKGANADTRTNWNNNTMLHCAYDIRIVKELLLYGARVNAKNKYKETPLATAVKGKKLEIVEELLKYRADVNAKDREGNTLLNIAVKHRSGNLELIKVLLEHGAEINMKNRGNRLGEDHNTPLDNAINDCVCAKFLIKYYLLKNFDVENRKIIDLDPYKERSVYTELSNYLNDCVSEIVRMKTVEIEDNSTLYDLVKMKRFSKPYNEQVSWKVANLVCSMLSEEYPIYNDIIKDKLKPLLRRSDLLKKLSELQIYIGMNTLNQEEMEKKVILDPDSTYNIANYLTNDDLMNLIIAFDDSNLHSSNNVTKQDVQFDGACGSGDHMNKRIKLE